MAYLLLNSKPSAQVTAIAKDPAPLSLHLLTVTMIAMVMVMVMVTETVGAMVTVRSQAW